MGFLGYFGIWFVVALLLAICTFAFETVYHETPPDDWDDNDVTVVAILCAIWPLLLALFILAGPVNGVYKMFVFVFKQIKRLTTK